ncbi:MAG: ATP synthase subunit I [Proteobacteria bacterium]|nr:ATP synthase subunit I [Pseudomonadota bacterium]
MLRYAALQMGAALPVVLAALVLSGAAAAKAALVGGLVVAVGNVVFGWTLFQPGIAPVQRYARALYAGEVLKWLWVAGALWGAFAVAHLRPLPLLAGLLAAQAGFWVGIAVIRD